MRISAPASVLPTWGASTSSGRFAITGAIASRMSLAAASRLRSRLNSTVIVDWPSMLSEEMFLIAST